MVGIIEKLSAVPDLIGLDAGANSPVAEGFEACLADQTSLVETSDESTLHLGAATTLASETRQNDGDVPLQVTTALTASLEDRSDGALATSDAALLIKSLGALIEPEAKPVPVGLEALGKVIALRTGKALETAPTLPATTAAPDASASTVDNSNVVASQMPAFEVALSPSAQQAGLAASVHQTIKLKELGVETSTSKLPTTTGPETSLTGTPLAQVPAENGAGVTGLKHSAHRSQSISNSLTPQPVTLSASSTTGVKAITSEPSSESLGTGGFDSKPNLEASTTSSQTGTLPLIADASVGTIPDAQTSHSQTQASSPEPTAPVSPGKTLVTGPAAPAQVLEQRASAIVKAEAKPVVGHEQAEMRVVRTSPSESSSTLVGEDLRSAEPKAPAMAEPKAPAMAEPKAPAMAEPKAPAMAEPKAPAMAEPKALSDAEEQVLSIPKTKSAPLGTPMPATSPGEASVNTMSTPAAVSHPSDVLASAQETHVVASEAMSTEPLETSTASSERPLVNDSTRVRTASEVGPSSLYHTRDGADTTTSAPQLRGSEQSSKLRAKLEGTGATPVPEPPNGRADIREVVTQAAKLVRPSSTLPRAEERQASTRPTFGASERVQVLGKALRAEVVDAEVQKGPRELAVARDSMRLKARSKLHSHTSVTARLSKRNAVAPVLYNDQTAASSLSPQPSLGNVEQAKISTVGTFGFRSTDASSPTQRTHESVAAESLKLAQDGVRPATRAAVTELKVNNTLASSEISKGPSDADSEAVPVTNKDSQQQGTGGRGENQDRNGQRGMHQTSKQGARQESIPANESTFAEAVESPNAGTDDVEEVSLRAKPENRTQSTLGRSVERNFSGRSTQSATQAQATATMRQEMLNKLSAAEVPGHVSSMVFRNQEQARLQLHPAELGRMNLELQVKAGEVQLKVAVESAAAAAEIQSQLGQLKEQLQSQGLRLGDVSVDVSQKNFDADGQSMGESGERGHESSREDNARRAEDEQNKVNKSKKRKKSADGRLDVIA